MLYLVITSLLLHVFALLWAIVLLRRVRDWRLAFVIGALVLVAVLELVTLMRPFGLPSQPVTTQDVLSRLGVLTVAILVLLSVYAIGAMIGDRERFVRLAQQNRERYRKLVDNIGVITWEAEVASWRFTFVSGRAESILGYPIEKWYEEDFWRAHMHPEDREWAPSFCHESSQLGDDYEFEYRMVAADGRVVWLHDVVSVTMRDGKPWRIHGAMLDITNRKQAEEQLQASEQRYRQLFELNPDPMWVFDRETLRFLAVNDVAIRHYGYSRDEFLSMTIEAIRPREDVDRLRKTLATGGSKAKWGLWRHIKKDGATIEVQVASDSVTFQGRSARLVTVVDVTERKRAEEERRRLAAEREQILARLTLQFDNMPVGCILTDRDNNITDWNPTAEQIFGWSKAEALGRPSVELLAPKESRKDIYNVIRRLRDDGGTICNTNQNLTKDGRRITCEWQNTSAPSGDGGFEGMLCTVQDVTERIAADEALRRSEARLRRVFNSNVIGIVFWTNDGIVTDANDVFLNMLGYSRDDLKTRTLTNAALTPPEYKWLDDRARNEMAATGVCAPFEKEFVRKDGSRVPILMGAGDFDDERMSGVAFVVDVTPLQRARELFRQSEERYRRLAEHGEMGIWEVRRDGRTVYANPAMCQMLEVDGFESLRKLDYRQFLTPESAEAMEAEQRRLEGEPSPYQVELVGAKGGRRFVMVSGAPVVAPGEKIETFLRTFTNVTELKLAEEALRQSQKMDAVGQLASGVAHDFNNLITAIFGYTSLARRTLSPEHPATKALDRVDAAAKQAAGVTRGLLTFSRDSSSEKKPISVGKTVLDTVQLLRRILPPSIELRANAATEGADWILADSTQIQQVVMNLAINARDAMPEGGRLEITVAAAQAELGLNGDSHRFVTLSVRDSGHGMAPGVLARIFEPFFTSKPPGQGTGLGLPIIHGIVKDHGGSIKVQSKAGEGTLFTVLLPRCELPPTDEDSMESEVANAGRGEVILLAEDQTYVREIIATMLQSLGYQVVQCRDHGELATACRSFGRQAKLMIIDGDMQRACRLDSGPRNGAKSTDPGDPVASQAPVGCSDLPTIIMVASAEAWPGNLSARTFFLLKPFQMNELAATVTRALTEDQEPKNDTDVNGIARG